MLSVLQSGFVPGDSCVHQLITIVHDIYHAFDANLSLEVRSIFLDISKTFDRVWHKDLLYKVKCMGIDGIFFKLVESFLSYRHQRVVVNSQASSWADVEAGLPQRSTPGPLFFLIYINDLSENLNQLSNFLQMMHQYFKLLRTPIHQQKFWTMTLLEFLNGHADETAN